MNLNQNNLEIIVNSLQLCKQSKNIFKQQYNKLIKDFFDSQCICFGDSVYGFTAPNEKDKRSIATLIYENLNKTASIYNFSGGNFSCNIFDILKYNAGINLFSKNSYIYI